NIAQGDILTLAAYLTFTLSGSLALPLGAAGILSVAATAVIVLAIYFVAFRPLRNSPLVTLFVASIGVALAIRGVISFVWGTELHNYKLPVMRNVSLAGVM